MKYREFLAKYGVLLETNDGWDLIKAGLDKAGYLVVDKHTQRWMNKPKDINVMFPVSMENWVYLLRAFDDEHPQYLHIQAISRKTVTAGYATAPEFAEFMKKYDEIHTIEEY